MEYILPALVYLAVMAALPLTVMFIITWLDGDLYIQEKDFFKKKDK